MPGLRHTDKYLIIVAQRSPLLPRHKTPQGAITSSYGPRLPFAGSTTTGSGSTEQLDTSSGSQPGSTCIFIFEDVCFLC